MPKVKNPTTFSRWFKVSPRALDDLGVLDPTLAIDTKLFMDPLLLRHSSHAEIRGGAKHYQRHFEQVIKFLARAKSTDDMAWRTARRLLEFHEIRGTCLGYGAGSIAGSGFGPQLTDQLLKVGREIVALGIEDPDLFQAMALFEAKIGPDRISDMTTNIIRKALAGFNQRVLSSLSLAGESFVLNGVEGMFMPNPFEHRRTPIILVPKDVLRNLPIANDWDEVADTASEIEMIRAKVNEQIAHIWEVKTRRDKQILKEQALASKQAFEALLGAIHAVSPEPYEVDKDPDGLISWARLAHSYTEANPLGLERRSPNLPYAYKIVKEIVARFKHLIEMRGLNKELYKENGGPRHESTAQKLFFAVAYCYCEANNLDISPEIDVGTGKIDFKFSTGFDQRILVEVKLSTNSKLVAGYERQLEVYKGAEETLRAIYLVIDVGSLGKKYEKILAERNKARQRGVQLSDLELVDGIVKPSASKR